MTNTLHGLFIQTHWLPSPTDEWVFVFGVGSEIICYLLKDDDVKSTLTEMSPRRIEFIVMLFLSLPSCFIFATKTACFKCGRSWRAHASAFAPSSDCFYPLRKSISHGFHQAWKRTIIECKIDRWSKICLLFCWSSFLPSFLGKTRKFDKWSLHESSVVMCPAVLVIKMHASDVLYASILLFKSFL